jgi:hypothetical protein
MATRKAKSKSRTKAKSKPRTKAKSKPKARAKAKPKAKLKAKPKAKAARKRKASPALERVPGVRRAAPMAAAEPEVAPELYALVCSTDGQLDGGLEFAACMDLARDHNTENPEHDAHCVQQLPQDPE